MKPDGHRFVLAGRGILINFAERRLCRLKEIVFMDLHSEIIIKFHSYFSSFSYHSCFSRLRVCVAFFMMLSDLLTASAAESAEDFIQSLNRLPTRDVYMKGMSYSERLPIAADSALMCYAVAFDRLGKAGGDRKELIPIMRSKIDAAFIVLKVYGDMATAYQYLEEALEMAERMDDKSGLCYANINIGFILVNCRMSSLSSASSADANLHFTYTLDGYRNAVECKDWRAVLRSMENLAEWVFYDDEPDVSRLKDCLVNPVPPSQEGIYPVMSLLTAGLKSYMDGEHAAADSCFRRMETLDFTVKLMSREQVNNLGRFLSARTNEKMGDAGTALEKLLYLYNSLAETDDYTNRYWTAGMLWRFYLRHGRNDEAERWHLTTYREKQNLAERFKAVSIEELRYRSRLSETHRILGEEREKGRKRELLMVVAGTVLAAVIVILTLWLYYSSCKRRYVMKMYEKHLRMMEAQDNRLYSDSSDSSDSSDNSENPESPENPENPENPDSSALLPGIMKILNEGSEPLDPDFQLPDLAEAVGSNTAYVSRAINGTGKNFKTILMERRVREACRLLDDPKVKSSLSIEGIARQSGFKSRSTFSTAFKTLVGLSPSEYRDASRRNAGRQEKAEKQ